MEIVEDSPPVPPTPEPVQEIQIIENVPVERPNQSPEKEITPEVVILDDDELAPQTDEIQVIQKAKLDTESSKETEEGEITDQEDLNNNEEEENVDLSDIR